MLHYAILAILVAALAYATHTWVDTHALAAIEGDTWVISGQSWSGMWPVLLAGLLPGLAVGLLAGSGFAKLIASLIDDGLSATRKKLAEDRAKLEAQKYALDDQIKETTASVREQAHEAVEIAQFSLREARKEVVLLKNRVKFLENRLMVRDISSKRKKKALLMRGDAPKPATV